MVCDAPRSSKSQENGPFHRNVWPGFIAGNISAPGSPGHSRIRSSTPVVNLLHPDLIQQQKKKKQMKLLHINNPRDEMYEDVNKYTITLFLT